MKRHRTLTRHKGAVDSQYVLLDSLRDIGPDDQCAGLSCSRGDPEGEVGPDMEVRSSAQSM